MVDINKILEAVSIGKKGLVEFRHIMLSNSKDELPAADFHRRWSADLLNGDGHEAIQGFRECAKTNYVMRAYLLYCIQYPSEDRDYIVIIKNNDRLARAALKEVETEARSNPLIWANTVSVREESGDVFSLDRVSEDGKIINIRIEAYGKGASVRGLINRDRRPKICLLDDVQDNEDAKSDLILAADWDWFLSDVMFLGQNTRLFMIGNNLGEKCIIERVFNNASALGFKVERIKILKPDGTSSWPEKFSVDKILAEKEAFRQLGKLDVWIRERMCEAVSDETRVFDRTDFKYFSARETDKIILKCNRFATLDPASSKDKESCYRAIVVNAVNAQNIWNIVDVPYGRWDSAELIDKIFEVVVKWGIREFGIEKGMFIQILEPFIYKEMTKRNIYFRIIPIEHAKVGNKLERIKMLEPRFKSHSIWFPDDAGWLTEMESELIGVTRTAIKSMYADLMDALAMQGQIAKAPYFGDDKRIQGLPRTVKDEKPIMV